MLNFGLAVAGAGVYNISPAAHYGHFAAQQQSTLLSGIYGPGAVYATLAEIDEVIKASDDGDRPSEHAKIFSTGLIAEAQQTAPIYLAASEIEAFEHGLLIHWQSATKRVVLVAPSDANGRGILYRKSPNGWSEVLRDPTPRDLSAAIAWVLQH